MAVTVQDVVTKIKAWHGIDDWSNDRALTTAECISWINQARDDICREIPNSPYTEIEDEFDTEPGEREYDLPEKWLAFDNIYYIDSDGGYRTIAWFPVKKLFDQRYPDRELQGPIRAATQWGSKMLLGKVPAEKLRIYRSYRAMPENLVDISDTDDFLDNLWTTIMWGALVISSEFATVPEAKQAYWSQMYDREIEQLRKQYKVAKTPPGRIISSSYGAVFPIDETEEDD